MLKFWPWLQLVGWEIDPMVSNLLIGHFVRVLIIGHLAFGKAISIPISIMTSHKNISNVSFVLYAKLVLQPYLQRFMHMLFYTQYSEFISEEADCVS